MKPTAFVNGLATVRHMLVLTWRADWRSCLLLVGLGIGNALIMPATAASMRSTVDTAQDNPGMGLIVAVAVGAVAFGLQAVAGSMAANVGYTLGDRVDLRLSEEILRSAASLDSIEHLERPDYLDRFEILRRNTRPLADALPNLIGAAAAVLGVGISVVMLMQVHPALAVMALLALPPMWTDAIGRGIQRRARDAAAQYQRREERLHQLCISPESASEIRTGGIACVLDQEATNDNAKADLAAIRAAGKALQWTVAGWLCSSLGYFVGIAVTMYLAAVGEASVGDVVLVVTLGMQLRTQIRSAVFGMGQITEGGNVVGHYLWFMRFARNQPSRPHTLTGPTSGAAIRLRNVSFTYPGASTPTLRNIDLSLQPDTTVALVGLNGAGKTTLVKLLTGIYDPTEGTIEVNGIDLNQISRTSWRRHISGVFQDFVKFELPVRQAVGVGLLSQIDNQNAILRAIDQAGARPVVDQLAHGLDTQLGHGHDGAELSHGQWQRIALARCLMRQNPMLLILDEPTAALDPQAEHDLYERYTGEASRPGDGRITLLVSHRFSTVRMADTIVVVDGNTIAEQGNHAELIASGGTYARMYNIQAAAYQPAAT